MSKLIAYISFYITFVVEDLALHFVFLVDIVNNFVRLILSFHICIMQFWFRLQLGVFNLVWLLPSTFQPARVGARGAQTQNNVISSVENLDYLVHFLSAI